MTPTQTLRAAATKLRELANAATRGPWTASKATRRSHRVRADAHAPGALVVQYASPADANLIAGLGPTAAQLLATWLDESAERVAEMASHVTDPVFEAAMLERWWQDALALARHILGETP